MEPINNHLTTKDAPQKNTAAKHLAQVLLLVLAIAFVCYGVCRGEADTVFTKAIRICLECVGIG